MRCRWPRIVAAGVVGTALEMSGCATLIHGTMQTVEIVTTPAGATATILPEGSVVTTPGTVELERKKAHTVFVELDGYCREVVYIDRITSNAIHGNILIGGMIGLSIDASNGAAYTLTPDAFNITLRPVVPAGAPRCAPIVCK